MKLKSMMTYGMLLIAISLATSALVNAADDKKEDVKKEAVDPNAPAPGEVDISDISNQYWKAHDKEFEVIQNKQYTKAGRIEVAPMVGIYQRVDYQDTKSLGASLSYHFSEMFGAELMGYKMFASDAHILARFKESTGATIEYNKEAFYGGASLIFTPIYGKFSVFGKKISHYDLYIAPGMGVTKTTALRPTPSIGVGQKFWLSPKWNFRIEYRWSRYNDRIDTTQGTTATKNGGQGYFDDVITNQNLMFGISYLFN
jgi:outer membrane beta-barrel protein